MRRLTESRPVDANRQEFFTDAEIFACITTMHLVALTGEGSDAGCSFQDVLHAALRLDERMHVIGHQAFQSPSNSLKSVPGMNA